MFWFNDIVMCVLSNFELILLRKRKPMPRGGGGGGTLIFSHIRRLGPFFWIQNSEFQYFWGFQKNEYFLGV